MPMIFYDLSELDRSSITLVYFVHVIAVSGACVSANKLII